jgi:hypothetical protein
MPMRPLPQHLAGEEKRGGWRQRSPRSAPFIETSALTP